MRNKIKEAWGKVRVPLLIIILMAGTWGWTTFAFIFPPMYQESQRIWSDHLNKQMKIDGEKVEAQEEPEAISLSVNASEVKAERVTPSAPASVIEKQIYDVFGEENYKVARAVAFAESRLNPQAVGYNRNGTSDCGVYQINSIHNLDDCKNPERNIRYAKELFDRSGWTPWVAYKTGKYLAYL